MRRYINCQKKEARQEQRRKHAEIGERLWREWAWRVFVELCAVCEWLKERRAAILILILELVACPLLMCLTVLMN